MIKRFCQSEFQKPDITDEIRKVLNLRKSGDRWVGQCPFHSEKTGSLVVYQSSQKFYCFGCGTGGDVIDFVRKYYNLSFPEALKFLGINSEKLSPAELRSMTATRNQERERREQWRQWQVDRSNLLGGLILLADHLIGEILPDNEIDELSAYLLSNRDKWMHQLIILATGDNSEKASYYRGLQR